MNPNANIHLPEVSPGYQFSKKNRWDYTGRRGPFPAVLWHEVIGHAFLGKAHPRDSWNNLNTATGPEIDPVIAIENMARDCMRSNGVQIDDRYPKYYGQP